MQNALILLCSLAFVTIIVLFIKYRALELNLKIVNLENYRLTSKVQLLERDVLHGENVLKNHKDNNRLGVILFTEEEKEDGWFSSSVKIRFKSQVTLNNIPIGATSVLKEDIYSEVDKKKIDDVVQNFAKPLLEAGIMVLSGDKAAAIKALSGLATAPKLA